MNLLELLNHQWQMFGDGLSLEGFPLSLPAPAHSKESHRECQEVVTEESEMLNPLSTIPNPLPESGPGGLFQQVEGPKLVSYDHHQLLNL
uniref:NADH dehydrogenase n=1 Tax=Arundo donax TaxID=35708 RepID=A0A0A9DXP1_ARUDO